MREEMNSYLNERGVCDKTYISFVLNGAKVDKNYVLCSVDGFDYIVSHFFDGSNKAGFGLIPTNEILKTNDGNQLAIGLIEGDDVICMNLLNGSISIWMIQTGNGEYILVSKSFKDFLKECVEV